MEVKKNIRLFKGFDLEKVELKKCKIINYWEVN